MKNKRKIIVALLVIIVLGTFNGNWTKSFAKKYENIAEVYVNDTEIVGKQTFITWNMYNGEYDGVQVLRSTKKTGATYKVIKTYKKKDMNFGYIDRTSNGKSYYYGVRAYINVNGKKHFGKMVKMKATKTTSDWFYNNDGYVKVWTTNKNEINFVEYDSNWYLLQYYDFYSYYKDAEYVLKKDKSQKAYKVNYIMEKSEFTFLDEEKTVTLNIYYDKEQFYYIRVDDKNELYVSYNVLYATKNKTNKVKNTSKGITKEEYDSFTKTADASKVKGKYIFNDFKDTMNADIIGTWYDPEMKEAIKIEKDGAYVYAPYLEYFGDVKYKWKLIDRSKKGLCPQLDIYSDEGGILTYYIAGVSKKYFWCNIQDQIFYRQ